MEGKIYSLIGEAMRKIGAIKKDRKNQQQGFMFRGIDAVYNALNPVMAELGLFIIPEVLEQTREERQTKNGSVLIYSILKVRFTMYAPDGSSVSGVVTGEGMDSGDKASNKAMSIALKYFAFETFMIPTEETTIDPDAEVHTNVMPKESAKGAKPQPKQDAPATVGTVDSVPAVQNQAPKTSGNPVLDYIAKERDELRKARKITSAENVAIFKAQADVLRKSGLIPDKAFNQMTMAEAENMVAFMYTRFTPTGTELLPDDGQTA